MSVTPQGPAGKATATPSEGETAATPTASPPTAPAIGTDGASAPTQVPQAHASAVAGSVIQSPGASLPTAASVVGTKRIIAVGGGKGGIGKSLVSANIAVHLAERQHSVALLDADLGGANLHTCLGMAPPQHTLSDFIERRVPSLDALLTPTTIPGVQLISGAQDMHNAANPKHSQKQRILQAIRSLNVDYVIIDLGAGTGLPILDFFLLADHGILTVIPEPTSIENAYRFVKAAYYRRLRALEINWTNRSLIDEAMRQAQAGGVRTPLDLVSYVENQDPVAGAKLRAELRRVPIHLVVNQVRSTDEQQLGGGMSVACERYFGVLLNYLGYIPYDDAVWQSVRRRRPLLVDSPTASASVSIRRIVRTLELEL